MSWFYGEFLGLPLMPGGGGDAAGARILRFKSERFELRIGLVQDAVVEPVACRLTIEVPSLEESAAALDEHRYPYDWLRGLRFTDQAIMLLDPAENRVILRRLWLQAAL